jgi:hypothetical protein
MKQRIKTMAVPSANLVEAPFTHYCHRERCANCLKNIKLTIPKGVMVEDFVRNLDCPHCGCPLSSGFTYEEVM